ncbi:MAG: hypothetical protein IJS96_07825 [Schwartzia sp.]|nr:hypothetical protein [Schwartzia sp. (in: firmicutes)]
MMSMNATAINNLPASVFADVLKKDILDVIDTNYVIVPREVYESLAEDYMDRTMEREAAKRLAASDGKTYTEQEMMAILGVTEKDIEAAGDVEIE